MIRVTEEESKSKINAVLSHLLKYEEIYKKEKEYQFILISRTVIGEVSVSLFGIRKGSKNFKKDTETYNTYKSLGLFENKAIELLVKEDDFKDDLSHDGLVSDKELESQENTLKLYQVLMKLKSTLNL